MKMRKLTEPIMEQLLDQYNGVIYYSLKKIGMYQSQSNFEDFYQLGCIKLFEAYETCEVDPLLEEYRYQFVNYAGQKLRWAFLDERRKEKQLFNHMEFGSDDIIESIAVFDSFEGNFEFQERINYLIGQLTLKEMIFLQERFYLGLTMTEIAKKYEVSRKTVYCWRNKIQEKAQFLLEEKIV